VSRDPALARRMIYEHQVLDLYRVKLARCPFCGSSNVALQTGPMPHVTCVSCQADGPLVKGKREQYDEVNHKACLVWNQRMSS